MTVDSNCLPLAASCVAEVVTWMPACWTCVIRPQMCRHEVERLFNQAPFIPPAQVDARLQVAVRDRRDALLDHSHRSANVGHKEQTEHQGDEAHKEEDKEHTAPLHLAQRPQQRGCRLQDDHAPLAAAEHVTQVVFRADKAFIKGREQSRRHRYRLQGAWRLGKSGADLPVAGKDHGVFPKPGFEFLKKGRGERLHDHHRASSLPSGVASVVCPNT